MFTAALFAIARTWKQPRCQLTDEWIKKLWYIYTVEYSVQFSSVTQSCPTLRDPMNHSGILLSRKRDKFESVPVRWMNLGPVMQSEISQKEKNKYHILMHIYGI